MKNYKKGPFQIKNGKPVDSEIFKDELSDESEARTDKIIYLRALNKRAKELKAKKEIKESLDKLMEAFTEI